jgi:hypothetical protein
MKHNGKGNKKHPGARKKEKRRLLLALGDPDLEICFLNLSSHTFCEQKKLKRSMQYDAYRKIKGSNRLDP